MLIGELAPIGGPRAIAPLKFLRDVTCSNAAYKAAKRCAPLKADGFALHPYQFIDAPQVRRRPSRRRPDRRAVTPDHGARTSSPAATPSRTPGGRKMELYLTEFGYLTTGFRAQKPKVRAAWLASAFNIARRNPRVRQLLQYQLIDPPDEALWSSGILTRDGSPQATYARPGQGLGLQPLRRRAGQ